MWSVSVKVLAALWCVGEVHAFTMFVVEVGVEHLGNLTSETQMCRVFLAQLLDMRFGTSTLHYARMRIWWSTCANHVF